MSSQPSLKLYSYWRSSSAWRIRIALEMKKLPYEYCAVSLIDGKQNESEYLAINPLKQVPALAVTLPDGTTFTLTQSVAIAEYLDSLVPEPACFNAEPQIHAQQMALALDIVSGIQPYHNSSVLSKFREIVPNNAEALAKWQNHFISTGLSALEQKLNQYKTTFACTNDFPTFIDMCLIPQLYGARRFNVDVSQFPRLLAIEAECLKLDYFIKADHQHQPDTPASERPTNE